MQIRGKFLMILFIFILLSGCSTSTLKNAVFTNVTPSEIKINDKIYFITKEILSNNEIEEQIGKVTQINAVVSYLETENLYKNPSKIFKVKGSDIEEVIAIKVNDKIYKAIASKTFQ